MKYPALYRVTDAMTAMELFDLAADMMARVRGDRATQRTAAALGKRLIKARDAQLPKYDRAAAECGHSGSNHS